MRAGLLNTRIIVQQQSTTPDALGQPTNTWTTFATLWADVKHTSGIEAVKAGAEASIVRASIRIRYNASITSAMRVTQGTTTYSIVAVLPDVAGKQYTDLVCEVKNADV
jgi:SPP1 family predicted phage head-tail adaptor